MLRLTTSHFPSYDAVADATGLPVGTLVSPLAPSPGPPQPPTDPTAADQPDPSPNDADEYIRSSAPESSFIPRCYRCAAYISIHSLLSARLWRCTVCNAQNTLPSRYRPAVRAGPRATSYIPEISRTTYDVPVADDVPVTPIAYVFLVDTHGDDAYLDSVRVAVRNALDVVDGHTLAGLILYGDSVNFLDARSPGSGGVLRSDLSGFSAEQWLRPTGTKFTDDVIKAMGNLSPSRGGMGSSLQRQPRRAMGDAVKRALDMVENASLTGARFIILAGGEPNIGAGALGLKESPLNGPIGLLNDKMPAPVTPFYAEQGLRASMLGVMIDMYMTSRQPVDVASLAPLVQINGGRLLLYDANTMSSSGSMGGGIGAAADLGGGREGTASTLAHDVWQHLNDPTVLRGLMRIRTSSELVTADVYGSGVFQDATVEDVYRLNCHGHSSTLAVEFHVLPKPKPGFFSTVSSVVPAKQACIQIAFRGVFIEPGIMPQRVLRVETVMVDMSTSPHAVWESADANVVATMMFQKALATADDQGVGAARVLLFDWLSHLVKCGDLYQKRRAKIEQDRKRKQQALKASSATLSANGTPRANGKGPGDENNGTTVNAHNGRANTVDKNALLSVESKRNDKNESNKGKGDDDHEKEDDGTQTWMDKYDSVRTVPQLTFGLIRSLLFRQEPVAPDIRAATRCLWEDLSPELLSAAMYPKLVSFVNIGDSDGKPVEASDVIGWSLPLTLDAIKSCGHGVFLVDAFSDVVIYYTADGAHRYAYPPPESSVVMKVKAQCLRDRPISPRVVICRQGTPDERWFTSYLVEDGAAAGTATNSSLSFTQFMQGIKDSALIVAA